MKNREQQPELTHRAQPDDLQGLRSSDLTPSSFVSAVCQHLAGMQQPIDALVELAQSDAAFFEHVVKAMQAGMNPFDFEQVLRQVDAQRQRTTHEPAPADILASHRESDAGAETSTQTAQSQPTEADPDVLLDTMRGLEFAHQAGGTATITIDAASTTQVRASITLTDLPVGDGAHIESLQGSAVYENGVVTALEQVTGTLRLRPEQGAFIAEVTSGRLDLGAGEVDIQGTFELVEGFDVLGPNGLTLQVLADAPAKREAEQAGDQPTVIGFQLHHETGLQLAGGFAVALLHQSKPLSSGTLSASYARNGWSIHGALALTDTLPIPVSGGNTLHVGQRDAGTPATLDVHIRNGSLQRLDLARMAFALHKGDTPIMEGVIHSGSYGSAAEGDQGGKQGGTSGGSDQLSIDAEAQFADGATMDIAGLSVTAGDDASVALTIANNTLEHVAIAGLTFGGEMTLPMSQGQGDMPPATISGTIEAGHVSFDEGDVSLTFLAQVELGGEGIHVANTLFDLSVGSGQAQLDIQANTLAGYKLDGLPFAFALHTDLLKGLSNFEWTGIFQRGASAGQEEGPEAGWTWRRGSGFAWPELPSVGPLSFQLPGFDWLFELVGAGSMSLRSWLDGLELGFPEFELGIDVPGLDGVERLAGKLSAGMLRLGTSLAGLFKLPRIALPQVGLDILDGPRVPTLGPGDLGLDLDLSNLSALALLLAGIEVRWPWTWPQLAPTPDETGEVGPETDGDWVVGELLEGALEWLSGAQVPSVSFALDAALLPRIPIVLPHAQGWVGPGRVVFEVASNRPQRVGLAGLPFGLSVGELSLAGALNTGVLECGETGEWLPTLDVQVGVAENPPRLALGGDDGLVFEGGDVFATIDKGVLTRVGLRSVGVVARVGDTVLSGEVGQVGIDPARPRDVAVTGLSPVDPWVLADGAWQVEVGRGSQFGLTVKGGVLASVSALETSLDIQGTGLELGVAVDRCVYKPGVSGQPFDVDATATVTVPGTVGGDHVSVTIGADSVFGLHLESGKKANPRLSVSQLQTTLDVGGADIGVTIEEGHYDQDGVTVVGAEVTLSDRVELGGDRFQVALTGGALDLDMAQSRVTRLESAGLQVEVSGPSGIVLGGFYADAKLEDGAVSGTAGLTLMHPVTLREEGQRGVRLKAGSAVSVTLANNNVVNVSVEQLDAMVLDEAGADWISVSLQAATLDLSGASPQVSGTVSAGWMAGADTVDLLDGWLTLTLAERASVSATLVNNDITAFEMSGVQVRLNEKMPDIRGVGVLPTLSWDGTKAGLSAFAFEGGAMNGLQLGKYFGGGIMRDLSLRAGRLSMRGMGDLSLPFGIKANVGLDLGFGDGAWLPAFELNDLFGRVKVLDGTDNLFSMGTKEAPRELVKTKAQKVRIKVPKVGTLEVDVSIGVMGYAKVGVAPVWLQGRVRMPEGYVFDPFAPALPDVSLEEAGVEAGLTGEAGVEFNVAAGKGSSETIYVGLDAGQALTGNINGHLTGRADLSSEGGKLGGQLSMQTEVDAEFGGELGLLLKLQALGRLSELLKIMQLPVGDGALSLDRKWQFDLGGSQEAEDKSQPEVATTLLAPKQVSAEQNDVETSSSDGGGMLEKLDATTTLVDLLLGAYGIFAQVLEVVVALDTVDLPTIADYVFNAPDKARELADNCTKFHDAAERATGAGGDSGVADAFRAVLNDAIGDQGTEWLLDVLEHYLFMVEQQYNGIDAVMCLVGQSQFEAKIQREMEKLRFDSRSRLYDLAKVHAEAEGYPPIAASNLAKAHVLATSTDGARQEAAKAFYTELRTEYASRLTAGQSEADRKRAELQARHFPKDRIDLICALTKDLHAAPNAALRGEAGQMPILDTTITEFYKQAISLRIEELEDWPPAPEL